MDNVLAGGVGWWVHTPPARHTPRRQRTHVAPAGALGAYSGGPGLWECGRGRQVLALAACPERPAAAAAAPACSCGLSAGLGSGADGALVQPHSQQQLWGVW